MQRLFVTCIDHLYHSTTPGVIHKQRRMLFCCENIKQVEAVKSNISVMKQFSDIKELDQKIEVDREAILLEVITPETDRYYFIPDFIKNNGRRAV